MTGDKREDALCERPRLHDSPTACPGGYSMHFYCKYQHEYGRLFMQEADEVETRTAAIRQMRADGWLYHRDGTATCPQCAKALRATKDGQSPTPSPPITEKD